MRNERTWAIEDHLCKGCGGRILRCVKGNGITGGGNPIFKCADCGTSTSAMGPEALCWCGFHHRLNHNATAYACVPFSILIDKPGAAQKLTNAFRSCGCEPGRGEVGIMLERDYRDAVRVSGERSES